MTIWPLPPWGVATTLHGAAADSNTPPWCSTIGHTPMMQHGYILDPLILDEICDTSTEFDPLIAPFRSIVEVVWYSVPKELKIDLLNEEIEFDCLIAGSLFRSWLDCHCSRLTDRGCYSRIPDARPSLSTDDSYDESLWTRRYPSRQHLWSLFECDRQLLWSLSDCVCEDSTCGVFLDCVDSTCGVYLTVHEYLVGG